MQFFPALRPLIFILGPMLSFLGFAMLLPASADYVSGNHDWVSFTASAVISVFLGGVMIFSGSGKIEELNIRQTFLLTVLSWFLMSSIGALPFYLSFHNLTFTEAVFETVSGLTTTGSTVLTGLDSAPPGILLWRGILQGIGGIGIIVMAIAILPFLRLGGMQLYRTESSDMSEKVLPRVARLTAAIVGVYFGIIALCWFALWAAGMTSFEAIIHSMAAVSTGGFSTSDKSIGHFHSDLIEWILTFFMIAGSLPFVSYVSMIKKRGAERFNEPQIKGFLFFLLVIILAMTLWLTLAKGMPIWHALTASAFNLVSIVTTTGFTSEDYTLWGYFPIIFVLFLTFVGGCTGSTAGGIKYLRIQLAAGAIRKELRRLTMPHGVYTVRYGGKPVDNDTLVGALDMAVIFVVCIILITLGLAATGLDFTTSFSGAATAMANVGPGLGKIIGPSGTFQDLSETAQWLLTLAMLLGRLEIFTMVVLATRGYWKDVFV
ncbi:TrkH family potassium uptake protein [Varunaivibrio sulfuroxidans]|uniref:Trk system potassium uptake protein n=1 Tax=Varunaivibrio sulfuroxidans TaxID=1773489 RepID=A0A4R3JE09_9PROT|nr:TrkH family potassium uptake protein [Varunaivibrio sulfuroxidans]TCS64014.1 trk system potassium uptake protein TrkH [Varunaivibrio sulfuroxidans]WES31534.1 TrkH family potassium uptake protein [Varunaivibrio sulfuroxidans]